MSDTFGSPGFFGKDSFTSFVGQVEDVDDPTHSGRVKVRCVGWHPKNRQGDGDDSLKTDDLPWARVGYPTTHAQQARIGGKHGLLPGTWVMGFFLDGDDAQDPFVFCTFNFTANSSDQDNRKDEAEQDKGKLKDSAEGFTKILTSPATQPNTALRTEEEGQNGDKGFMDPNDKAGDSVNNDSDSECGGKAPLESESSNASKNKDFQNPGNTEGQKYNTMIADGRCGSNQNAREDIQVKMQEQLVPQSQRFVYGDVVWQRFEGNFVDMNGIMAQLALLICALLKQLIQSLKSEKEDQIYRNKRGATLVAVPDRDGYIRPKLDEQERRQSDIFHTLIAAIIDQLCSLIMNELQKQNNSGEDSGGGSSNDNSGGDAGTNPVTRINNPRAKCLADQIINNVLIEVEKGFDLAIEASEKAVKDSDESNDDGGSSLDAIMNIISSVLGFGSGMLFPLSDKYTEKTDVHNSQGNKTQDKSTRDGCKEARFYNSEEGAAMAAGLAAAIGAFGGGGSGGGGGSSGGGGGASRAADPEKDKERRLRGYAKNGPGGMPEDKKAKNRKTTDVICEEANEDPDQVNDKDLVIEGPCNVYSNREYTFRVKNNGSAKIKRSFFSTLKRIDLGDFGYDYSVDFSTVVDYRNKNKADITFERSNFNEKKNIYFVYATVYLKKNNRTVVKTKKLKVRVYERNEANIEDLPCPRSEVGDPPKPGRIRENPTQDPEIFPDPRVPTTPDTPDGIIVTGPPSLGPPPEGSFGEITLISLPSPEPEAARNFVIGTPNVAVIENPGTGYFYNNPLVPGDAYPSIYIPGYSGIPIPVVEPNTGELVTIITNPSSFDPNRPLPPASIIPDQNPIGFSTTNPNIDVEIAGFYVQNTGFNYCAPVIKLWDRDKLIYSEAQATLKLIRGRIVDCQLLNSGRGFLRIPRVDIVDNGDTCGTQGGYGAKIYPIMKIVPRYDAKPLPPTAQAVYCPSKDMKNRYTVVRDTEEMVRNIIAGALLP